MGDQAQKNMQELLNMSLKLTDAEQKTYEASAMDDERKEFLQGAIHEMLENDDSKRLVLYTNCLKAYKPCDVFDQKQLDDLEVLFEALNYLMEGFDVSKDFNTLGGLQHTLQFLKVNTNYSIRWQAADLIANSIHNDTQCQKTILDNDGLEVILENLKVDNELLQVKCMYALSTLLGGNVTALKSFLKSQRAEFFIQLLDSPHTKMKVKAAFLLRKIVHSEEVDTDGLITVQLTKKLCEKLEEKVAEHHIHLLHTLSVFLQKKKDNLLTKSERKNIIDVFLKQKKGLQTEDKDGFEDEIEAFSSLIILLK